MKKLLALITAVILLNFGSMAYAVDDKADSLDQQRAMVVKNSKGEYVGTISNALMDSSGNIAFIILVLGEEEQQKKEIAVPSVAFTYDHANKNLLLNISYETLAKAPEFNISDLSDPTFAEKVYRFYGRMPAWTEEI
jgi:hypothetical protein